MKTWLCLLGLTVAIGPLRADWKITTATTDMRGGESVRTDYYKGKLQRTDGDVDGAHRSVNVVDPEHLQQTMWDPGAKQYMATSLAYTPRATPVTEPDPQTRPVLLFESNTTDTGERQTLFGRTARHLTTSEKQFREERPGAESKLESERVTDGWYVDVSGLPESRGAAIVFTLVGPGGQMPIVKATHTGTKLSGLAVREKVTFPRSGGSGAEVAMSTEVRELYEGVLPQSLFEPPSDYKRVAQLANPYVRPPSFSDELEVYWNTVENWFLNWFS